MFSPSLAEKNGEVSRRKRAGAGIKSSRVTSWVMIELNALTQRFSMATTAATTTTT